MNEYSHHFFDYLCKQLSEIVTDDYILVDVPHYTSNVGDALLWKTTSDILSHIGHHCLYECSIRTYVKPNIKKNTLILIHPGGNFGDIWIEHQKFRHLLLKDFPDNPIVQLPQSVWFNDPEYLKTDIEIFRQHKCGITICLRDRQSYDMVCKHYPFAKAVLLPDMALSFDIDRFRKPHRAKLGGGFLLLRDDHERKDTYETIENHLHRDIEYGDWPCMQKPLLIEVIVKKILYTSRRLGKPIQNRIISFCYKKILRPRYIMSGIQFLDQYQTIYSTRLHAAIIAQMLGKEVHLLDNSYGKCHSVYDTWMKELPNIIKENI